MAKTIEKKPVKNDWKLVVKVSIFWIALAVAAYAFVQYGHTRYNAGIFEGLERCKAILNTK